MNCVFLYSDSFFTSGNFLSFLQLNNVVKISVNMIAVCIFIISANGLACRHIPRGLSLHAVMGWLIKIEYTSKSLLIKFDLSNQIDEKKSFYATSLPYFKLLSSIYFTRIEISSIADSTKSKSCLNSSMLFLTGIFIFKSNDDPSNSVLRNR